MAKKNRRHYDSGKEVPEAPSLPEMAPERDESQDKDDALVILAVIAHKNRVDPAKPQADALAIITEHARELGIVLSPEVLTAHLRLAHIELLQRQLVED